MERYLNMKKGEGEEFFPTCLLFGWRLEREDFLGILAGKKRLVKFLNVIGHGDKVSQGNK